MATLVGIYPETFIIPTQIFRHSGLSEDPDDTFNSKKDKNYIKVLTLQIVRQETATTGFWWRGTATKAKKLIDDPEMKDSRKLLSRWQWCNYW